MKNYRKIFLLSILSLFLLFFLSTPCQAVRTRELEVVYPEIGSYRPTSVKTLLPKYIEYMFSFSLMIAGLICFGSLILGGIRYLTSAGSPSVLSDAKDQIFAAILGSVILLCSYLILTTLNPQIIKLELYRQPTTKGIVIYNEESVCENTGNPCQNDSQCTDYPGEKCLGCGGQEKSFGREFSESLYDDLSEKDKALKIRTSVPNLREFLGDGYERKIHSVWFFESWEDISVSLFPDENWGGTPSIIFGSAEVEMEANTCHTIIYPAAKDTKSIKLLPKPSGVYLCDGTYTNCTDTADGPFCKKCNGNEISLRTDSIMLPPEFHDKVEGIMFKNIYELDADGNKLYDQPILKYGAVLHQGAKYEWKAELFLDTQANLDDNRLSSYGTKEIRKDEVSSITVFALVKEATGQVIFYEGINYTGDHYKCNPVEGECCPYDKSGSRKESGGSEIPCTQSVPQCIRLEGTPDEKAVENSMCVEEMDEAGISNNKIKSIKIEGNFIAILFEDDVFKKKCTIFKEDDKDFIDDPIGRCHCVVGDWGCGPCLSSFIILPIK